MRTSERQFFRGRFVWLYKWWWSFYRQSSVSARTPPPPTPCGEGVGRPRRLHPSARTRYCTAVLSVPCRRVETVGSRNRAAVSPHICGFKPCVAMSAQGFGVVLTASVESPSFHAVFFVTVRPMKCDVSSLTDLVGERLHCHVVLWHDGAVLLRRRQTQFISIHSCRSTRIRVDFHTKGQSTPFLASSQFVALPCSKGYLNFDTPRLFLDSSS